MSNDKDDRDLHSKAWAQGRDMLGPKVVHQVRATRELRERSGEVRSDDPLVSVFYSLLRDHVRAGDLEGLVVEATRPDVKETLYTNGWLAEYAKDLVMRLEQHYRVVTDRVSLWLTAEHIASLQALERRVSGIDGEMVRLTEEQRAGHAVLRSILDQVRLDQGKR